MNRCWNAAPPAMKSTKGHVRTAESDGYGGYEDAVYLIVSRTIDGGTRRYVERLVSRTFPTVADAWRAIVRIGRPITSFCTTKGRGRVVSRTWA